MACCCSIAVSKPGYSPICGAVPGHFAGLWPQGAQRRTDAACLRGAGPVPALLWLLAAIRPAVLEGKISAFLGDISYAVYLLHVPLGLILVNPAAPGAWHSPGADCHPRRIVHSTADRPEQP